MSKVLRPILQVAALAVNFIPGLGQLASFAITAALTIGSALLPVGSGSGRRTAAAAQLQIGEQPRQAVFGRAALGGTLVDAFNYGGKYGTDWEVLVIALADHRCDALEGFFVDDTWVPYTGDGDVPGFNGQLRAFWRNGAWGQEVPWILTDHGPGWTADDRGWNVAYAVVAYKADDEKAKNPIWTSGRPRFRFVVRGLRCYDSRKDSTVGGSGSHRRDNAETWEFSENPIVIRHNWVRGIYAGDQVNDPAMLLIGRGLSALEAPPQNVFPRANLCDELVEGQPRYTIGGLVAATEPYINVENDFAAAVGGVISQPEGAVEVDPGQARAAVAHFTDDDIIVGSRVSWSRFLGQQDDGWVNTVVARFTDPEQRWNIRSAPVRRETADIIADRGPREQQPQLDFVTNLPQAQRIAEIIRRLGRLWARATVTLPPRFAFLEEGDWVTWQSDRRFGGATRTFRIEAWGSNEAWHHQLTLRQISASVFSDTDPLDDGVIAGTRTPPPVVAAPGEGAWSASLIYYEDGGLRAPAVRVQGAVDDPAAQLVVFEFVQQLSAPDANTVWSFAGTSRPNVTRVDIPVTAGGRYWVGVAYSVDGILGDRRVLGPVDAGELTYADGTPVQDLQPAEPGATQGATLPGNIKDQTGRLFNPGELLNTAIELTPSGRLQYRPLPDVPPITLGTITLPDLGAASAVAIRRAEDDIDQVSRALATALDEASRTRAVFTDAGFYSDPATGQVRIHAIEQTRERVSLAEIRLNAAEANINLRATVNYVDEQLALAVFDPSQIADLETVFLRLTAAEVDIDGLQATVTTLATATELSLVAGRVTTAESAIDALEGTITSKVDTTTFNALASRVTTAESTLTAIGDTAQIVNAVRSVRLVERDQEANAENDLRVLLQGDRARRDQVAAIALARQEITSRLIEGDAAEAAARQTLQVRIGQVEATAATETIARISGQNALASQITQLTASTTATANALSASIAAETANRTAAINSEADARVAAITAEAAARGTAITAEQQARIDAINAERAQTLADIAAEAAARQAAVVTLTASIQSESAARTSADSALAAQINTLSAGLTTTNNNLAAEQQARVNAINAEAAARVQAIQQEAAARGQALTAEEQARIAAINAEATARANAIAAEAAARQQAVTSLTASITEANQARVSGDNALAASITNLTASLTTTNANIAAEQQARVAAINAEADARVAAINAEAQARGQALTAEQQARIAAINAERQQTLADVQAEAQARQQAITSLAATVQTEQQARIDGDALIAAGLAQQVTAGRVADGEAAALAEELLGALLTNDKNRREANGALAGVRQEITAQIVSDREAFTSSLTALVARVQGNEASIVAESQARATAIESVAQSVTSLNATFTTAISAEQTARIAAIANEAQTRANMIAQEADARGAAIINERDARIAAIQAEAAARGTALTAEEQARIAAITAEANARAQAIAAEQAARQQAVSTLTAAIQNESVARANGDGALASQITNLNASFSTAIAAEQTARADAIAAEGQARANMIAQEANARGAAIISERDARIAAIQAEAQARGTALTAEEQARIAAINAEATARANAIAAEAAARQQAVTTLTASIQSEATARANADGALAGQITNLTTTVNGNTASINQFAESINGLQARVGVRLDVNGRVTGWVLNNNGQQGTMDVVADSFRIFGTGLQSAQAPFQVTGGNLRLSGNVRVGGDLVVGGTLTADKFVADGVTRAYDAANPDGIALGDLADIVTIPIVMERPGTIILMADLQLVFTTGSWAVEIAVGNTPVKSGTGTNNDNFVSFFGRFTAATPGTYQARIRASGTNVSINPGGASLVALRTYT